jgi:hypothetical protein
MKNFNTLPHMPNVYVKKKLLLSEWAMSGFQQLLYLLMWKVLMLLVFKDDQNALDGKWIISMKEKILLGG